MMSNHKTSTPTKKTKRPTIPTTRCQGHKMELCTPLKVIDTSPILSNQHLKGKFNPPKRSWAWPNKEVTRPSSETNPRHSLPPELLFTTSIRQTNKFNPNQLLSSNPLPSWDSRDDNNPSLLHPKWEKPQFQMHPTWTTGKAWDIWQGTGMCT